MKLDARKRHALGTALLFLLDALTLLGIFYLSVFLRRDIAPRMLSGLPPLDLRIGLYYWLFPLWLFILSYGGGYSKRFTFWDEVRFLSRSTILAMIAIFTVLFIGRFGVALSRVLILSMAGLSLIFFPLVRTRGKILLYRAGLLRRKLLIIGSGRKAKAAYVSLKNEPNMGYEVAGFVDDDPRDGAGIEGVKVLRHIDKIPRYIKWGEVTDLLIAKPELGGERLSGIINSLQHKVASIFYVPELSGIAVMGTELKHFFKEQTLLIEIKNNLERPLSRLIKRTFDYSAGVLLFVLFLLPMVFIALLIRLTSKGPSIFAQERIVKNGMGFMCYKFRTMTMHPNADERLRGMLEKDPEMKAEWETHRKLKDDPRVTPVGRFLRKTSLDELPQFLNILKGEMSLVGPRPYLPGEWDDLKEHAETILNVPPGITGLWQVSGRSETTFKDRLAMDSWYVRNWNLWLDIMILLKTVGVVLRRQGAR